MPRFDQEVGKTDGSVRLHSNIFCAWIASLIRTCVIKANDFRHVGGRLDQPCALRIASMAKAFSSKSG